MDEAITAMGAAAVVTDASQIKATSLSGTEQTNPKARSGSRYSPSHVGRNAGKRGCLGRELLVTRLQEKQQLQHAVVGA